MIEADITALYTLPADATVAVRRQATDDSLHRRFLPTRAEVEGFEASGLTQVRPVGPEYEDASAHPYETSSIDVAVWSDEDHYHVVELKLQVRSADERGLILALKDLYDPDVRVLLDGTSLSGLLNIGDSDEIFGHRALIIDMLDSARLLDTDKERIIPQLLFKDFNIAYDLGRTGVELPTDLNAPVGNEIYVWAGQALIWRADAELRRRFRNELVALTASSIAARERTETLLEEVRLLRVENAAPEDALRRIAELQRDLESFVQAPLQTLASSLGRPMARYLEAQTRQLNMDTRVRELADLLAQAQRTAELELRLQERTAARQAAEAAADVRTVVTIFAVISVLLNIAGMMIAAISIPSATDARFPSLTATFAVVGLMGIAVAALAGMLLVFARIQASNQQRTWVGIGAAAVVIAGVVGLVAVVVMGASGAAPFLLIGSFGLLALATLLLAWRLRLSGSQ